MSELASMPMFWAEFFADTEDMPEDAAKAYLFLLGHAWLRGARLPDDDAILSRLSRVGPRKWAAIKKSVMAHWRQDDDGFWTQKRLSREYDFVRRKIAVNRANGSLGGRRAAEDKSKIHLSQSTKTDQEKDSKNKETAKPNGSVSLKHPTPTPTPTPTDPLSASAESSSAPPAPAPAKRGPLKKILSESWIPNPQDCAYAAESGFGEKRIMELSQSFRDYHRSKGNRMADWSAAWRNWVRNEIKFHGKGEQINGNEFSRRPRQLFDEPVQRGRGGFATVALKLAHKIAAEGG